MRECLQCKSDIEKMKQTAKFCSTSCRVMYNRKHGKKNTVTPVQMQALYNATMEALGELKNYKPVELPADYLNFSKIGVLDTNGNIEPLNFSQPQIALKSFEQWQKEKRDCEIEEDWEKIKAGIKAATNLTAKQKDLLIKYS